MEAILCSSQLGVNGVINIRDSPLFIILTFIFLCRKYAAFMKAIKIYNLYIIYLIDNNIQVQKTRSYHCGLFFICIFKDHSLEVVYRP